MPLSLTDIYLLGWIWTASGMGSILGLMFLGFGMGKFISVVGAKALAINPLPNRRMEILKVDDGELAYSKKRGYFFVNPEHVYIESKSSKPIFIAPSILGKSVDPKKVKYIDSLKGLGIRNLDDLEAMADDKGMIEFEVEEGNGKDKKTVKKEVAFKELALRFGGQSIPVGELINYFHEQMPADLQESKIQHRVAVENIKNKKRDLVTAVVLISILLVCGALAIAIMGTVGGNQPPVDPGAIASAVESGIAKSRVVQAGTSTGLG